MKIDEECADSRRCKGETLLNGTIGVSSCTITTRERSSASGVPAAGVAKTITGRTHSSSCGPRRRSLASWLAASRPPVPVVFAEPGHSSGRRGRAGKVRRYGACIRESCQERACHGASSLDKERRVRARQQERHPARASVLVGTDAALEEAMAWCAAGWPRRPERLGGHGRGRTSAHEGRGSRDV